MVKRNKRQAFSSNIKKSQSTTRKMSTDQSVKTRAASGTKGDGDYYRIVVRPKEEFITFRIQDIGDKGHIQRLAGKKASGSWDTQAWLISKEEAHVERNKLVADSRDVSQLFSELRSDPTRIKADVFAAKDRRGRIR